MANSQTPPLERAGYLSSAMRWWIGLGVVLLVSGATLLVREVQTAREGVFRSKCRCHLKCLALALYNYSDTYGSFPPAYSVDEDGQPLHSWRTLLLPFIDRRDIYERLDLSRPWNDPVNAFALDLEVATFTCHSLARTRTTYQAVVTDNSAIRRGRSLSLQGVEDRPETTFLVIEVNADRAVHWMEPVDNGAAFLQEFDESTPATHGGRGGRFYGLFSDGMVHAVDHTLTPRERRSMTTATGGEKVTWRPHLPY
jgi:hypothetical protein